MSEPSNSPRSAQEADKANVPEAEAEQESLSSDAQSDVTPRGNWFTRWLNRGLDNRNSRRESLPWVVAFFFSGGPPKECELRNLSPGGAFVFTDERWHRGTIVRMTLTDRREAIEPNSITVNAMVSHSTSDGVGFQFIFVEEKKQRRGDPPPDPGPLVNVTKTQFRDFLRLIKTNAE